jgi:hypothetical protein
MQHLPLEAPRAARAPAKPTMGPRLSSLAFPGSVRSQPLLLRSHRRPSSLTPPPNPSLKAVAAAARTRHMQGGTVAIDCA